MPCRLLVVLVLAAPACKSERERSPDPAVAAEQEARARVIAGLKELEEEVDGAGGVVAYNEQQVASTEKELEELNAKRASLQQQLDDASDEDAKQSLSIELSGLSARIAGTEARLKEDKERLERNRRKAQ